MGKFLKTVFFALGFSYGITLQEVESLALKNFYEIKKRKKEVEQAQEEVYKAMAEFLPKIDFSYSFFLAKKQDIVVSTPFFSSKFTLIDDNFYKTNIVLNQNILNFIVLNRLKVNKIRKELKILELEAVKNSIKFKVREAYINALKSKAITEVLEKQVKRLEEHYRNVKALYKEGYVALKDVLETKVKLYEVRNKLLRARANYKKSLDFLSYLAGKKVTEVKEIKKIPTLEKVDLSNNPRLKVLKTSIKLSKTHTKVVASYFYPLIDFSVVYQRTNESPSLPQNRYFISVNLKWNFFNGGKKIFELKKARRNVQILELEYLKEKELLKTKLKNILRDIKVLKWEIETANLRLEEAKEHYKLALEKYKNGLGTNVEVLDAEAYLTSAEQELKIKKYDLILAKFKLLEVIGR